MTILFIETVIILAGLRTIYCTLLSMKALRWAHPINLQRINAFDFSQGGEPKLVDYERFTLWPQVIDPTVWTVRQAYPWLEAELQ